MNIIKKMQLGIELLEIEEKRVKKAISDKTFKYPRNVTFTSSNADHEKIADCPPLCSCKDCALSPTILIRVFNTTKGEPRHNYRCKHDNLRYVVNPEEDKVVFTSKKCGQFEGGWDEMMWRDL